VCCFDRFSISRKLLSCLETLPSNYRTCFPGIARHFPCTRFHYHSVSACQRPGQSYVRFFLRDWFGTGRTYSSDQAVWSRFVTRRLPPHSASQVPITNKFGFLNRDFLRIVRDHFFRLGRITPRCSNFPVVLLLSTRTRESLSRVLGRKQRM
jgi:hypothetical protein